MPADCPRCHGTGFALRDTEPGVLLATRCDCDQPIRGERLLRASKIPRRYEHCSFESFEPQTPSHEQALGLTREWAALWPAIKKGLLFQGTPGTGKTHLAVALARELMASKAAQVLFCEQRALLRSLQGTFESGSSQRESEILGPVQDAEVLILDDLGAGRTTPWARDVMHDIIAQRYNEERPLILTSNLALGDEDEPETAVRKGLERPLTLRDRLGDALMSRLHEMCRVLPLHGKDYRSWILPHKDRF